MPVSIRPPLTWRIEYDHHRRTVPDEVLVAVQTVETGYRSIHVDLGIQIVDVDDVLRKDAENVVNSLTRSVGIALDPVCFLFFAKSVDVTRLRRIAVRETYVSRKVADERLEVDRIVEHERIQRRFLSTSSSKSISISPLNSPSRCAVVKVIRFERVVQGAFADSDPVIRRSSAIDLLV